MQCHRFFFKSEVTGPFLEWTVTSDLKKKAMALHLDVPESDKKTVE